MPNRAFVPAVLLCTFLGSGAASAQPLGTYSWQQQPYCNVFTVNIFQTGSAYQMDGTDDQCGAATRAALVGIAFLNPNGTLGLGFTVVTSPGGTPLHVDASISVATGSGTWRDNSGGTGPFVLTPGAGAGGSVRPIPRSAFPAGLSAGGTTIVNVGAPVAATDAATKAYVDTLTANVRAALIGEKVWKAAVNSNGTKQSTGPFTSSTFGTGLYNVVFNVTGLGLPSALPIGVAIPVFCAGGQATIGSRGTSATNNVLTNFSVSVATTNAAGVATNCEFELLATFPDADSGSAIPPLVSGGAQPGVTCTTIGEVTTCVTGSAPQ
jgi:hypothetical protein